MKITVTVILGLFGLIGFIAFVGWIMWRCLQKSDDPGRLIAKWVISAVLIGICVSVCLGSRGLDWGAAFIMPIAVAVCGVGLGVIWAPNIATLLASPLTSAIDGGSQEIDPRPFYSIAEAKRKRGHYMEAIAEVRRQLERFPEDFTGWMMLADIHAENLNDLAGASGAVETLLAQEGHSPKNIAYALNRLADWHLKLAQDPDSARRALERITEILPASEEAQVAFQRISHPVTREDLIEKHQRTPIHLPHHDENIGLRHDFTELKPPPEDPAKLAAEYVKHLEQYPHDNEAREKLALVYVGHYQRLDLAADQLEQLIAAPHQPSKQVVHWLNLLADLQIKLGGDAALARQTFQRIIDTFPKSAAAENARNRIAYLNLQLKPQQKSQVVKLGSYEQNIGLKDRK
ncbi:MAG: tetratricopeptide repeat protein [Verrucomicrobia bacterium]|nr:tetratricopeptide repeat protein [Verrucomicrobiota bacterium]